MDRRSCTPIAPLREYTSDGSIHQQRRQRERGSTIRESFCERHPLHTLSGVGSRVEKALRQILAHRVVLLVADADLGAKHHGHAVAMHRIVQVVLPFTGSDRVTVAQKQGAIVHDIVAGKRARGSSRERRDAVTVFAEERCPVDDRRPRRIVNRAADDRAGLSPGIEQRARPARRNDDVILDDGDGVAPGRLECHLPHLRDRRVGRHRQHGGVGEPTSDLGPNAFAKTVDDEHLDRDVGGLLLEGSEATDQIAEPVDRRDDDGELKRPSPPPSGRAGPRT